MPFQTSKGTRPVAGFSDDRNPFSQPDTLLFGKWLADRLQLWQKSAPFEMYFTNLGLGYAHRYGIDVEGVGANAAAVTRSGEQGTTAEMRIPVAASLATKVHNVIVGPELVWTPVATTTDYSSEAEAIVARNALMYYWADLKVGSKAKSVREDSGTFAEGFLHVPWDKDAGAVTSAPKRPDGTPMALHEGDINARPVMSWDGIRDPSYHSYEEQPFTLHREFINKYDVVSTIEPEDPEEFARRQAEGGLSADDFETWATNEYERKKRACLNSTMSYEFWAPLTARYEETDLIAVYYLYHKQTGSVVNGRQTRFLADGTVLEDDNLDPVYEKVLPLIRISGGEYKGTPFPYCKWMGTLGSAQAQDKLRGDRLTNATATSSNIISTVEGDDFPVTNLGGPQVVKRGKDDPVPQVLQLHGMNPDAEKLAGELQSLNQQVMGVDGLTAGTMDSSKLSGAADVFLASTTVQNNSQDQAKWAEFVSTIGTLILHIIKGKMTVPRKVALAGSANASLVTTTELSSNAVKGFDRVQVTVGGALQQSEAGKLTFAQMMIAGTGQPGGSFVETPQQLQSMLNTGRVDSLNQTLSQELLLINEENEMIAKGQKPTAMLSDDQKLHITEHKRPTANVAARSNPAVVQAAIDHLQEHINLLRSTDPVVLQALGQQPLPPPTPPPMPGALPGGPPAGQGGPPGQAPQHGAPSGGPPHGAKPPPPAAGQPDAPSQPNSPVTGKPTGPVAGTLSPALAVRPS